jgi:hypothetical protein
MSKSTTRLIVTGASVVIFLCGAVGDAIAKGGSASFYLNSFATGQQKRGLICRGFTADEKPAEPPTEQRNSQRDHAKMQRASDKCCNSKSEKIH